MSEPVTRLNVALEGRYHVVRNLGEGGMATVYLAEDLKHGRKVALKVLKPELAAIVGPERFLAEIKTTASLQHPHILPLHDSGQADGFLFYVMPYVEGESLRDRLDREHQLPVDEAVRIATAVAQALDYAHRRGVIHRDIKPPNILVRDGQPVISDFGIALAVSEGGAGRLTETGLSLGTPHYMSPEQATGDQTVGPATDVWALGCVLYEMLVGEPPYTGSTPQAVLGKIITAEAASASAARRSVPANVDAAIRKALEKLPADRFGAASEFARALGDPGFRHGDERASATIGGARWNRFSIAAGASTATLAAALGWLLLVPESLLLVERFPNPFLPGEEPIAATGSFELSSDGTMLAYEHQGAGGTSLMVRRWNDIPGTPVRETDGASQPVFSPDAESLAFVQDGQIRVLALDGGPVRTLGPGAAPYWAEDGNVYARSRSAVRYPASGGPSEVVSAVEAGEAGRRIHGLLPGGRRALLGLTPATGFEMRTIDLETGETGRLGPGEQPRYARSGHLLYLADQILMAAPFDAGSGEATGPATPMIEGVQYYSLAVDGKLFYSTTAGGARRVELVWVTRSGGVSGVDSTWTFDPGVNEAWSLSPDENRLAIRERGSDGSYDIWVRDLLRGRTLLTDDEGDVRSPVWTGENEITYASIPRVFAAAEVRSRRSDGLGDPRPVAAVVTPTIVVSPSDGALVFAAQDIYWFRPRVDAEPQPLLADPDHQEREPAVSPDGRWIAYASNESGTLEVEVRPFPNVDSGRWPISTDGGNSPKWSLDGRELFFRAADGSMMAVGIRSGSTFDHDPPRRLFPLPDEIDVPGARLVYEVTRDGRFLMSRVVDSGAAAASPGFVLITNFFEELREQVPVR